MVESVNIWSHLALVFLFLYLSVTTLDGVGEVLDVYDRLMIRLSIGSCVICFLCSTFYHMFKCYSDWSCQCLLSFDIAGIILMIYMSTLTGIYFGYECYVELRMGYMVILSVVSLVMILTVIAPEVIGISEEMKTWTYASFAAFGVIPLFHWCGLKGLGTNGLSNIYY